VNRKLIVLAVAGACGVPAAMAQTSNPVTLYGRVYATFESVEATGTSAPLPRRNRVSDQVSLMGVRGTEQLGNGLSAFFQLETGFRPDSNDTTFATRNSGVGLQGGWGSVILGRWDTPLKATAGPIDPFGDVTLGGLTAAMHGSGLGLANSTQFDRRDQNVVQYWSPAFAGIAVRLQYSANENRTATTNPGSRGNGASVTYTGGPVYVGYAWDQMKDNPGPAGIPVNNKQTANAVFGTFTLGAIRLGLLAEQFSRTNLTKQKAWMGNIVWTLGNNQFIYQHQDMKDGFAATVAIQPACKVDTLAWQYNFSRRTMAQLQYSRTDNNAAARCDFGSQPLNVAAGMDPKGISLGIRQNF
jgi:predicted porin